MSPEPKAEENARVVRSMKSSKKPGIDAVLMDIKPLPDFFLNFAMDNSEGLVQDTKKMTNHKRNRDEVVSRSRSEIIKWVLDNEDLIKVCICPYCYKIHSRRDNARVHIKNQHKGYPIRDFVLNVDANIDEVRKVNETGRFMRMEKRMKWAVEENAVSSDGNGAEGSGESSVADNIFSALSSDDQLQSFLEDIERRSRETNEKDKEEASTSVSGVEIANSMQDSREASPANSVVPQTGSKNDLVGMPYGCVVCPCSFQKLKNLEKHVASFHRTHFRCNICWAEFVKAPHLEQHIISAHSS